MVRILGYNIFSFDHGSGKDKDWHSFDIRPIRNLLETYKWSEPRQEQGPVRVLLPSIVVGTPDSRAGFISAPAGANIRTEPIVGAVLAAAPFGAEVRILDKKVVNGQTWNKVNWTSFEGWMSSQLIGAYPPEPSPTPEPEEIDIIIPVSPDRITQEEKWKRSREFVRRWEGGYQNIANDTGNWTGGKVGVGENKGTKYGITAASYPQLDIKNLTMEQADHIYFRDYWQKSGAFELSWPACLLVFDTAVLHGVGTARNWLAEVGSDPNMFFARRLRSYTKQSNWDFWGKAWVLRVAELAEAMAQ